MEQKHENRTHALLSASGADRWLNCTPSARLETRLPDYDSLAAKEGELAHELLEAWLNKEFLGVDKFTQELERVKKHPLYTDDMLEHVAEVVNFVSTQYTAYKGQTVLVTLHTETKLDFSPWVLDGYGTGDIVIITPGTLHILDFKYGKGVEVSAEENPQLILYALGAYMTLTHFGLTHEISLLRLSIMQPRMTNYSTWELSLDQALTFADQYIRPRAEMAYQGLGEYVPGDHCQFCKAKAICPALFNLASSAEIRRESMPVVADLGHLPGSAIKGLLDLYGRFDALKTWMINVEKYLLDMALRGAEVPGYKLVQKRTNRRWADVEAVQSKLASLGIPESDYLNSKLGGLGQISNLFSVDDFKKHFNELIYKPVGGPALTPLDDKRPAYSPADLDFNDVEITE